MRVEIYHGFLAIALLLALWRGGRAERLTALVWFAANLLSYFAERRVADPFYVTDPVLIAIDVATAAALVTLAARHRHRWLTWIAALQIITAASHFVAAGDSGILGWVYQIFVASPGWLICAILLGATVRYELARRRAAGAFWRSSSSRRPPGGPT